MRVRSKWFPIVVVALMFPLAACGGAGFGGAEDNGEEAVDADVADEEEVDLDRDEVTISMVSAFPLDSPEHAGYVHFEGILAETAPWVTIEHRGASEAIPSAQQGDAVADGAVDMATLPINFYSSVLPLTHSLKLTTQTPPEERESGAYDFYQEKHDEVGLHWLGRASHGVPFRFFMNEPIDELDFGGLDIRVSAIYVQAVQGLGGTPVQMDPGDVYTALERGTVDGYGWAGVGLISHGWQDVTDYEIDIDFYEMDMGTIINKQFWDDLDEETRQALTDAMIQAEDEMELVYGDLVGSEVGARRDAGVEPLPFSDDEVEEFLDVAYERGWEEAVEYFPEAEELREIYGLPTD